MPEWCTDSTLDDSLWKEEEDGTTAPLNSPLGILEEWTNAHAKEATSMNVGSLWVADEDMIPGPVS